MSLVGRLRYPDREPLQCDADEAASMLEFIFGQMRACPKMNGQHRWRFDSGWPMTCAIGTTPEEAIRAAMEAAQDNG